VIARASSLEEMARKSAMKKKRVSKDANARCTIATRRRTTCLELRFTHSHVLGLFFPRRFRPANCDYDLQARDGV
jgi:hypothetical protein